MEITDEVQALTLRLARNFFTRMRHVLEPAISCEDVEQQALLIVWRMDETSEMGHVNYQLRLRLIDWIRAITHRTSKSAAQEQPWINHVSLDERLEADDGHLRTDLEPRDDSTPDSYRHVEDRVVVEQLFREFPGRDADITRLVFIGGLTLREVGERYGISEARTCQIQKSFLQRVRVGWGR